MKHLRQYFVCLFLLQITQVQLVAQNAFLAAANKGGLFRYGYSGTLIRFNADGTNFQKIMDVPGVVSSYANEFVNGGDGFYYSATRYNSLSGDESMIYKIKSDGSHFTIIKKFDATNRDVTGASESGPLLLAEGKLWGENNLYGAGSGGVIFSVDLTGDNFNPIKSFINQDVMNGSHPFGGLVKGTDGFLYGVNPNQGNSFSQSGVVFKIRPDGSSFQIIHTFASQTGSPTPLTFDADGNLYGGHNEVGGQGIIYSIKPDGSDFKVIHQFDGVTENGYGLTALLVADNGDLYGTTYASGANKNGTLFKISGATYSTVFEMPVDWGKVVVKLAQLGNELWCPATYGGKYGKGVIFKFDMTTNQATKMIDLNTAIGYEISSLLPITIDPSVLSVPSSIQLSQPYASNISDTSFKLDWNSVLGASSYQIDVAPSPDFSSILPEYNNKVVYANSALVANLNPATSYYVRIRAKNDVSTSENSETYLLKTAVAPPVATVTNVGYNYFTLTWPAISSAIDYRYDVATDDAFTNIVDLDISTLAQSSTTIKVPCPGTYYVRLRSTSALNISPSNLIHSLNSATITVVAPLFGAPDVVSASEISSDSFVVQWGKVAGATSYFLDVATSSDFSALLPIYTNLQVNSRKQVLSGLQNNTIYYFRVRASNGTTTSGNSEVASASTVLSPPVLLPITNQSTNGFMANWLAVPGATSYLMDVYQLFSNSPLSGYTNVDVGNATTFAVTGLAPQTLYYYRVKALNGTTASAYSVSSNLETNYTNAQNQTINFVPIPDKRFGDPLFGLSASASSGKTITSTSSNTSVAISLGNTVTIRGVGTTTITVAQAGGAPYNPAGSVSQVLNVLPGNQTITFNALPDKTLTDPPFTLQATASSKLAVSYSSSNPSVATVFGNKVTLVGPGSTVITAQQEIDNRGFYNPAIPVTQTLTVKNPGNVTLFTSSLHDYKNSEVLVPVRATGFNKIISSQFSVTWDPNVITYLGTESFNLSGMDANAFGLTQTSSGRLSVAWFEPHLLPQTIADNDTLFLIRFKLTGSYGSSTPVEIGNQPLSIELIDNTHSALATATQSGTVSINVDISISGKVYYPNHEAIQQVTVNLNEGLQSATSSSNGDYHFDAPAGSTYSVEPQKINDPHAINGIDAADIAALRRHILGVQILDSPYKIIAGDVNSSQSLSTIDLVLIQELILGINSFPVDKQWTFVLADYTFAGDSPFPYPSNVTLTQVDGQIAQDFVGVKFGDVNISRDNTQQDRLTNNAVIFLLEENKVDSSEIEVIVRVKNFTSISAYQFTLTWDPSRFDYLPSVRQNSDAAFGTSNVVDGALSVLWDDKSGRFANLEDETELFRFSLAKRVIDATVKDVNITSTITPAAVYNNELKRVPYQVLWKDPNDAPVSFALLQNYPNSFSQKTNIFFDVPEEGEVQLSIIDSNGREITTWRNSCAVGRHVFEWSGVDKQGSQVVPGLYVCVARYGSLTKFIKMIKN